MKKVLTILLVVLFACSVFAQSAPETATNSEDGSVYTIRVASDSEYRANALVEAGKILNEQLVAEGSKDSIVVEFIETKDLDNSMFVWSQEGNVPEILERTITGMYKYLDAGYVVDASYVVNDDVYTAKMPESVRSIGSTKDGRHCGVVLDTECRVVTVYWPALKAFGWTDEQIAAWKADARDGKITCWDLQDLAKQIVDAGICEYGILIYPGNNSDWDYNYGTWAHGGFPLNDKGQVVLNKADMVSFLTYYRRMVQLGLIPYNWLSGDFSSTIAYTAIGTGKAFAYMGNMEIKTKIMGKCNVDGAYVDENYITIPNPVSVIGDKPVSGANPYFYGLSVSSQKTPKMAEYCRRLLDCVLDTNIQLGLSLATTHLAITDETVATPEYQADKFMADLSFLTEKGYIYAKDSYNVSLNQFIGSQEMFNCVQEAMMKATDPTARPIEAIADDLINVMKFNIGEGNYVVQ